jgi:chemotaxis-related protein WspD
MAELLTSFGPAAAINDCWNKIGVRGDASCPELKQYGHCRNCPVFASAALSLLDRELPPGYAAEWQGYISMKRGGGGKRGERQSAILFRLGTEWFSLPTAVVDEVAELRGVHTLPHRRGGMLLGLVNVQGELIVCVSLARMLGLEDSFAGSIAREGRQPGRLLVVRSETGRIAFPVDEVERTQRYHPGDLKAVPATLARAATNYTKGILAWRDRQVGCLDGQMVVAAMDRCIG